MDKRSFLDRSAFRPTRNYRLLPFRFGILQGDRYILTNEVGEYVVLPRDELAAFIRRQLAPESPAYRSLKSKHFLYDDDSTVALDLLALKYRSRAEMLAWFTGLHIFVVTLRCTNACRYCQASRRPEESSGYDMSPEHAEKALSFMFRSPSPVLKVEFQGGEPLLNFSLVRYIVQRAQEMNEREHRELEFVIATNLARLDNEVLAFCKANSVYISTSLDGPRELHNQHRIFSNGQGSYDATVQGIRLVSQELGQEAISALMTTTRASMEQPEAIIDEYVHLGFTSIFLRNVRPYGHAANNNLIRESSATRWIEFYKQGLSRVLQVNREGHALREEYTAILLQKIFTPLGTRYVDLQSPAGLGTAAMVYNYDGAVYTADEGRMLGEMGDQTFRLGHLDIHSYEEMMTSESFLGHLMDTMLEGVPMCHECPYLPYCGADPVFHWATQGDVVGHKVFSAFCTKQKGVLGHLFLLLEDDPTARETLISWIG